MRRMSPSASPTLPVCLRVNSATSTASQMMWFWQTAWNQKVEMPTERLPDLGVPDVEARGERLAVDLGPAGRVDEEAEQVLLPAVEPGPPPRRRYASCGGRKSIANSRSMVSEVRVVEPRVGMPVDGADQVVLGEELERLVPAGMVSRKTRPAVSARGD